MPLARRALGSAGSAMKSEKTARGTSGRRDGGRRDEVGPLQLDLVMRKVLWTGAGAELNDQDSRPSEDKIITTSSVERRLLLSRTSIKREYLDAFPSHGTPFDLGNHRSAQAQRSVLN